MTIRMKSFAYSQGRAPNGAVELDCRPLRNPHHSPTLRSLTGLDAAVQDYVRVDPGYADLEKAAIDAASTCAGGVTIAFGCFGGKHRSVAVAEMTARRLRESGFHVEIEHTALRDSKCS